ncbi:hypothetical protein MLD38_030466 [Melastoma candidum]|uniref:Uncharacterized protein n=1 Tax=Melastoma candidum TaxID=119954 RepID=A0ACB9MQB5_9MYRT|nr:hypothetical protein MLD38_030466 [Melastoma candidum]
MAFPESSFLTSPTVICNKRREANKELLPSGPSTPAPSFRPPIYSRFRKTDTMGGCASRPKEFDADSAPQPVEAPETVEKVEAAQEGGEESKEAPLVDLSEPAEGAPPAAEEGEKKEEEKKA